MPVPDFSPGEVLTASAMDSIGLWLVKTQTVGTAVSNVTVTGAFSSTYENYLVIWNDGTMSAQTSVKMKLGTTATAGFFGSFIYANYTNNVLTAVSDNNAPWFTYAGGGGTDNATVFVHLFGPNKTKSTRMSSLNVHYGVNFGTYTGVDTSTNQHTSFVLEPFTGTMTGGTIRVYGYRN